MRTPATTNARHNHRLMPELLTIGGYVVLTVIFTYPLAIHPASLLVGIVGDAESHLWSFWWMQKAVVELHSTPYYTAWLYYPGGVSLYFYAYNVVHAFLSIPLQELFGLVVAYNLTELCGFVAAGWFASWLVRDVTGSYRAGFVGGIVYAFAPIQMFHFNLGQPNLHGVEFMPLYVLCLLRWLQGGAYRWMLGAVIALALNSYSDWQFAVYMHIFTAIAGIAYVFQPFCDQSGETVHAPSLPIIWRVSIVEIAYLLVVSPIVVPMVQEMRSPKAYMFRSLRDTVYHSPDLLAFFIPNPEHPLWRAWALSLSDSLRTPGTTLAPVSLVYVALCLGGVAMFRHWKHTRFWFICGMTFLVLSLGPSLRILGEMTNIPLPYELLYQWKLLQVTRAPARYFIVTTLCLAILAGIGIKHVQKVSLFPSPTFLIMTFLLCFELFPLPINISHTAMVPSFYTDGTLDQAGALMEWPDISNRGMYYATIHGHPTMYGEMSRDNPPEPLLKYVRQGPLMEEKEHPTANWPCLARMYHLTHLVVYHEEQFIRPTSEDDRNRMLNKLLPTLSLVQHTPLASLYRIPFGHMGNTCIFPGDGWGKPRSFGEGQPHYRWMGQQAQLGIVRSQPGRVVVHFSAHTFAFPRHVELSFDGTPLATILVNERQPFAQEVDVPAGFHWLELLSIEPATSPAQYGYEEQEPVTIALSEWWVEDGQ